MTRYVLDASALLALLMSEPGAEVVAPLLSRSLISSVNVAEVLSKLSEKGIPLKSILEDLELLDMEIVSFDLEQASIAGELRQKTKSLGLSLGDRCCLALAIKEKTTAVTADRSWAKVKACPVKTIR